MAKEKNRAEQAPLTLDELKARLRQLKQDRKAIAKEFHIPGLGVTFLIAPGGGAEFFSEVMKMQALVSRGEVQGVLDPDFMRVVIKACVVEPELDDEALNELLNLDAMAFQSLANACLAVSLMRQGTEPELFGITGTAVQEDFLGGTLGSGNT